MHILTGLVLGELLLGSKALLRRRKLPYELIHVLPGRLRIRVEAIRQRPDRAGDLSRAIGAVDGVKAARANSRSATLLVSFADTADNRKALIVALERWTSAQEPDGAAEQAGQPPKLRRQLLDLGRTVNARVYEQTQGVTDLGTLLALSAGGWGVKTLLSPGGISRWQGMTLLYWSYNMLQR